jgi:hypothetical protein
MLLNMHDVDVAQHNTDLRILYSASPNTIVHITSISVHMCSKIISRSYPGQMRNQICHAFGERQVETAFSVSSLSMLGSDESQYDKWPIVRLVTKTLPSVVGTSEDCSSPTFSSASTKSRTFALSQVPALVVQNTRFMPTEDM